MIKLVVAYGPPEDAAAFDEHYASTHAPVAQEIPGLQRFEAGKVLGRPDGAPAPSYFIAEPSFEPAEDLQTALGTDEGQAAAADNPNFASGGATLMIVEA
jgi:uncharacterized protein (TIGR02118 family)